MLHPGRDAGQPRAALLIWSPMNRDDVHLGEAGAESLRLVVARHGDPEAAPLLALHGITASRRYWMPRVLPAVDGWRLVAPDLPGFGASPKPVTTYDMDFFVAAIRGLIQQEGWEERPVTFLAHSLGTLIALEYAVRHPERVAGLLLISVPRFRGPAEAHEVMLRGSASYRTLLTVNSFRRNLSQVRRTGLQLTVRSMSRLPWAVLADARRFTFRSMSSTLENCLMHYDVDPVLERFPADVPTRLIHGDRDQVALLPVLREAIGRDPRFPLNTIRGAGHHPLHTHRERCLRAVRRGLDALRRRT